MFVRTSGSGRSTGQTSGRTLAPGLSPRPGTPGAAGAGAGKNPAAGAESAAAKKAREKQELRRAIEERRAKAAAKNAPVAEAAEEAPLHHGELFEGVVRSPFGPLKDWPFRLLRDGRPVDPNTLDGGKTENGFRLGAFHTDAEGRFRFWNLPDAAWSAEVHVLGGRLQVITEDDAARDSFHRAEVPAPIEPAHVEEPVSLDAAPAAAETIAGVVRGPAGVLKRWPFRLLRDGVAVSPSALDGGRTSLAFAKGAFETALDGSYRFEDLPSADWSLEVLLPGGKLVEIGEDGVAREQFHRGAAPGAFAPVHVEEPVSFH